MIREMKFEDIPPCSIWWRTSDAPSYFGLSEEEVQNTCLKMTHQQFGQFYDSRSSFVSYKDGRVNGLAVGLVVPLIFAPHRKDLYLVAVHSDNNITTGKLFKKWLENAKELPGIDRILVDRYWSTNFNYEKMGFSPLRETFYMER